MMPPMHSATTPGASPFDASHAGPAVPRAARARALAFDLALCVGGQVAAATMALVVFLLQTSGGERDLTSSAATAGWAIALAGVPAWLGLLGHSCSLLGGTPGQRGAHVSIEGTPGRRIARLALHPTGTVGWAWLALVAALAAVPGVAILFAAVAILGAIGALVSAAILVRDPAALPVHDRIAGTRLVPAVAE